MCMCMALCHETEDNCFCNTMSQYVVNSMIGLDCLCLVVSPGLAHVFVKKTEGADDNKNIFLLHPINRIRQKL